MSAGKNKDKFVLDTYAIFTYLKEEPGWHSVKNLLWEAYENKKRVFFNYVNFGELYYILCRENGMETADKIIAIIKQWPIKFIEVKEDIAIVAGRIKAENKLSYADAYVVATALTERAAIITGDREFKSVNDIVNIIWLPRN